jgi:chemotaxis protein histidine kinase CheA
MKKKIVAGSLTVLLTINGLNTIYANEDASTVTTHIQTTETGVYVEELEVPALIPGDFFYIVKTMVENIQVALTFNDLEKAKLLAEIAQERIKESNALIAKGETELAEKLLQQALLQQEAALDVTENVNDSTTESSTDAANNETDTINGANENVAEIGTDAIPRLDEDLKAKLTQNIEKLLAVMEKIENPKTQEALAKNIGKSFEKLEKRIGKLEKAQDKATEKLMEAELKADEKIIELKKKLEEGKISEEEAKKELVKLQEEYNTKKLKLEEELANKIDKIEHEIDDNEQEEIEKASRKALKEAEKEAEKETQEKAKENREEAREARKEASY